MRTPSYRAGDDDYGYDCYYFSTRTRDETRKL